MTRTCKYSALCSSHSVTLPCWRETCWSLSPSDSVLFVTSPCTTSSPLVLHGHLLHLYAYTQVHRWPAGGKKTISYSNCMLQVFTMHFFGGVEVFILTAMAFDRYAAICKPLHYVIIMNRTRCHLLVLGAWAGAAVHAFPLFSTTIGLPFCGPNVIDHYYCDVFPLLKVACTDTYITGVLVIAFSGMFGSVTFIVFFVSYGIILFRLRNLSAEGRHKALSTCGSHITKNIKYKYKYVSLL